MIIPSVSSVELNFLVFRYLHESGFTHAAYTFGYEAGINKCAIDGNMVPMGALIKFVQKGLHFLEMEANLDSNDAEVDEDFSFLQPMDLITKDVYELREIVKERRKNLQKEKEKEKDREREKEREKEKEKEKKAEKEYERERARIREKDRHEREKEVLKDRERYERDKEREKLHEDTSNKDFVCDRDESIKSEKMEVTDGTEPMENAKSSLSYTCDIPISDVLILDGHTSEVCACAWSPTGSLLASGSGDSTARIWAIPEGTFRSNVQSGSVDVLVLKHVKGKTNEKSKDVTTLDWNGDGNLLATGSYDGHARVWASNGELKTTLSKHKGPIFSLKWNKKGEYLLTGSCDKTAIVWDVKAEEWKQQFEFHAGPILDVDWRNNASFATSSTDHMIYVCKIGENRPIKAFAGHQGEVNCVKWDPTGSLLASCSDDISAKIWSMKQEKYVHDLKEHSKEIYTLRWSPTGPATSNPNQQLVLASASFDSTVKLWDVEMGKLLGSLNGHKEPVYSVAFSPNGEFLASGSLDKTLIVWSLKEGRIVRTFTGNGGIFEVCWNKEGNKIAACFANNTVSVIDLKI